MKNKKSQPPDNVTSLRAVRETLDRYHCSHQNLIPDEYIPRETGCAECGEMLNMVRLLVRKCNGCNNISIEEVNCEE